MKVRVTEWIKKGEIRIVLLFQLLSISTYEHVILSNVPVWQFFLLSFLSQIFFCSSTIVSLCMYVCVCVCECVMERERGNLCVRISG